MHTDLQIKTDANGCVTYVAPAAESNRSRRKRVRKLVFLRGLTFLQAQSAADHLTIEEIDDCSTPLPSWAWETVR